MCMHAPQGDKIVIGMFLKASVAVYIYIMILYNCKYKGPCALKPYILLMLLCHNSTRCNARYSKEYGVTEKCVNLFTLYQVKVGGSLCDHSFL